MHLGRTTLSKFLIQQLQDVDDKGKLAALLVDVAAAVKAISAMTAKGALGGFLGAIDNHNVQGEQQKKLDVQNVNINITAPEEEEEPPPTFGALKRKLRAVQTATSSARWLV